MSYLASGRGPVLESDMPFVNSEALINLAEINKQAGQHVENYVRFPTVLKENQMDKLYIRTEMEKYFQKKM